MQPKKRIIYVRRPEGELNGQALLPVRYQNPSLPQRYQRCPAIPDQARRQPDPLAFLGPLLFAILLIACYFFFSARPQSTQQVHQEASTPPRSVVTPKPTPSAFHATQVVHRIAQMDPAQYASGKEHDTWAGSACSVAALTEVANAYQEVAHQKKRYLITNVLAIMVNLKAITPELGLLHSTDIDRTASVLHLSTTWLAKPSVDDVVAKANAGNLLIVSFPPDRWTGGHLLLVKGGNEKQVYLVDSSRLDMQVMDRQTFIKYWGQTAAFFTPTS